MGKMARHVFSSLLFYFESFHNTSQLITLAQKQMKIQRKILFSLGIVLSLVLVVSAWGFSPTSADPTVSIPNGIQQYTDLCKALKNIEGEKLFPANCQLWATQSDQDKAVKNICDKYDAGSDHKLKGQCDAYSAAIASSAALASQPVTTTPHACGGGSEAVSVKH